eukprot:CFRG4752T1
MKFVTIATAIALSVSSVVALSARQAVCTDITFEAWAFATGCSTTDPPSISLDVPTDGTCTSIPAQEPLNIPFYASADGTDSGFNASIYLEAGCTGVPLATLPVNYQLDECVQIDSSLGTIYIIGTCASGSSSGIVEPTGTEECCPCPDSTGEISDIVGVSVVSDMSDATGMPPSETLALCCPCDSYGDNSVGKPYPHIMSLRTSTEMTAPHKDRLDIVENSEIKNGATLSVERNDETSNADPITSTQSLAISPQPSGVRDFTHYANQEWHWGVMAELKFWRIVFRRQVWGSFMVALTFIIATGVMYFTLDRPNTYFVYEFTTGGTNPEAVMDTWFLKPYNTNLIPAWAAIVVPIALFLLNLVLFEFWLMRKDNGSLLAACITILHFFLDALASFFFQQFFQQLFANFVAEPRPNMFNRCNVANLGYANGMAQCDVDAFHSFFSGHSSASMNLGVYYSFYVAYTVYFRSSNPVDLEFLGAHEMSQSIPVTSTRSQKRTGKDGTVYDVDTGVLGERGMRRILNDFAHALVMFDMILGVSWGLIVGLTRVTDYAHHPWDVVTGWFVGLLFALLLFPRAAKLQPYLIQGLLPTKTHPDPDSEMVLRPGSSTQLDEEIPQTA